jgi:glutamyl-tRNA synthetase
MMRTTTVRFAPSPTGRIHVGNARTALFNYLFARRHAGRFVLRFDDTDLQRSTAEFAAGIELDLAWLGIEPDFTLRQSERFAHYEAAAEKLRGLGRLYPCFETPDELDRRRKRQASRGLPPIYDRAALQLTAEQRKALVADGRRPHWRFLLDHRTVTWDDLVRGPSHIDCASLSDPILMREDGTWLYTLPSVVDDIEFGITHVIRGEDHVTNTAVQIQIFELLAGADHVPCFAHHNLLTTSSGEGLSKRTGSLSIASLREQGIEPLAVCAFSVLTGSSDAVQPVTSLSQLTAKFDIAHTSRGAARFDPAELVALSARTLHQLDYESVRDRLSAHDIAGHKAEPFWNAVRGNLTTFLDVVAWWRIIEGEIQPVVTEPEFLEQACQLLPPEPWDAQTFAAWMERIKEATGRKGKALFHPLRLALTGLDHGPELAQILPLLGRVKVTARLS